MDEPQVRTLLARLADSEPPPARVSIGLAREAGRARLRRRRAALAGAPVLAVAAIVAGVLATGASPGVPGAAGPTPAVGISSSPAGGAPATAPARFNPLIPFASFGWLPAGQSLVSGDTSREVMSLTAGPGQRAAWSLTLFSAGHCRLTGAPGHRQLSCTVGSSGQAASLSRPAPAVRGHRAYWGNGYLVWQYARGGWAWLSPPRAGRPGAVKVAAGIRYGGRAASIAFPAQLTGLPPRWQVTGVYFRPDAGVLRASQYSVALSGSQTASGQTFSSLPALTTDPATTPPGSCYHYAGGQSVREVVGGYRVTVNHFPAVRGNPPEQQLCATSADGLAVFISEFGRHPAIDVVTLFAHHLLLLGPDPANWTRTPIG